MGSLYIYSADRVTTGRGAYAGYYQGHYPLGGQMIGYSVAVGGDVDGDGFGDVIVAQPPKVGAHKDKWTDLHFAWLKCLSIQWLDVGSTRLSDNWP